MMTLLPATSQVESVLGWAFAWSPGDFSPRPTPMFINAF
jgi:hypothetical protein